MEAVERLALVTGVLSLFAQAEAEHLLWWDCSAGYPEFYVRCDGVFSRELDFVPIEDGDVPELARALRDSREAERPMEFPLLFAARKRRQQPRMEYLDTASECVHRMYLMVRTG